MSIIISESEPLLRPGMTLGDLLHDEHGHEGRLAETLELAGDVMQRLTLAERLGMWRLAREALGANNLLDAACLNAVG